MEQKKSQKQKMDHKKAEAQKMEKAQKTKNAMLGQAHVASEN